MMQKGMMRKLLIGAFAVFSTPIVWADWFDSISLPEVDWSTHVQTISTEVERGSYFVISNGYDGSGLHYVWQYSEYDIPLGGPMGTLTYGYQRPIKGRYFGAFEATVGKSGGKSVLTDLSGSQGPAEDGYATLRKGANISGSFLLGLYTENSNMMFLRAGLKQSEFRAIPRTEVNYFQVDNRLNYAFERKILGLQLGLGFDTPLSDRLAVRLEYGVTKYPRYSVSNEGVKACGVLPGECLEEALIFGDFDELGDQTYHFSPFEESMSLGVRYQLKGSNVQHTQHHSFYKYSQPYTVVSLERESSDLFWTVVNDRNPRKQMEPVSLDIGDIYVQLPPNVPISGTNLNLTAGWRQWFGNRFNLALEGFYKVSQANFKASYKGRPEEGGSNTNSLTLEQTNYTAPINWSYQQSAGWGFNVLPGIQVNDNSIFYGKVGVIMTRFKRNGFENDLATFYGKNFVQNVRGIQGGIGSEVAINNRLGLRLEFTATRYRTYLIADTVGDGYPFYFYVHKTRGRTFSLGARYNLG